MMNELELLNNVMGSLFGNEADSGCSVCGTPDVDVKETKTEYTLEMELPGRTEKDVNIELDHGTLTISSVQEKKHGEDTAEKNTAAQDEAEWLIRERRTNAFSRSFTLPEDVNTEGIAASFKNGILTVFIPRAEAALPKRIAIEPAA
jgi:HSP20 family protein